MAFGSIGILISVERRMLVVPFDNTIQEKDRITNIVDLIIEEVTVIAFDSGRMIERGKDYDAFDHLRFYPNLVGSYKHEIIEA
jgi:hypothetical protein